MKYHILGFNKENDYGEIFVTIDNSNTLLYKGYGKVKLMQLARTESSHWLNSQSKK